VNPENHWRCVRYHRADSFTILSLSIF
jgi:hypothetical protein